MERLQEHILTHLWLAGHEGMDKKMETTIMGDIETVVRIHSFIPSEPKVSETPKMFRPVSVTSCGHPMPAATAWNHCLKLMWASPTMEPHAGATSADSDR